MTWSAASLVIRPSCNRFSRGAPGLRGPPGDSPRNALPGRLSGGVPYKVQDGRELRKHARSHTMHRSSDRWQQSMRAAHVSIHASGDSIRAAVSRVTKRSVSLVVRASVSFGDPNFRCLASAARGHSPGKRAPIHNRTGHPIIQSSGPPVSRHPVIRRSSSHRVIRRQCGCRTCGRV